MAVGILSAYAALGSLARGRGWNSDRLCNLVALLVFGGLAGARAFFVAEHWSWYAGDPLAVLRIWEGGLMYYGSIVAGAAILAAWCVATKTPPLPLFDLFAAVVPLGQAFGRVGCFMNGCCHGRVADSFVSVAFPAGSPPWMDQVRAGLLPQSAARSLPVLPVQLFEAAGCFLLFLALRRLFRTKRAENVPGLVLAAYLAGYGALRFATELLRADERARPFGGPLSISQCISLAALAIAAALLLRLLRRR